MTENELNKILYLLPVLGFFSKYGGVGGHISHSYGVVNGFIKNGFLVEVLSSETDARLSGIASQYHQRSMINYSFLFRIVWNFLFNHKVSELVAKPISYLVAYCRYSIGYAPWIDNLKRCLGNIPLILEVNSIGTPDRPYLKSFERQALLSADIIVCVSETLCEQLVQYLGKELKSKIYLMPNAVDIDRFDRVRLPINNVLSQPTVKVGYSGIIKPNYNLDVLFEGVKLARHSGRAIELHVAGDGPWRKQFKKMISGNDWVLDYGKLCFDQIPSFLNNMDILICPQSKLNYFQSPLKLFEYMAAGRPIIGACNPPIKNYLGQDDFGIFYQPDDHLSLARSIDRLISYPEFARNLARNALQEVRAKHTWEVRINYLIHEINKRGLLPC